MDDLSHNMSDKAGAPATQCHSHPKATTLTAQIAEIEARLSEEKNRRERDRVLSEIETIQGRESNKPRARLHLSSMVFPGR